MLRLYPSMAFTNIKSNGRMYFPYMLTCIVTAAIYYTLCSLGDNSALTELWGGNIIRMYMSLGQVITAVFALIFLFYINSFLVKRRRSEFGLYNILGLEKRHITKILFFENVFIYVFVMATGIFFGILFDKLMHLILSRMFDDTLPIGFYISASAISKTLLLFGIAFLLILASSVRQVYKAKPVELLKSDSVGEREPKAKWVLAALGMLCLGTGYFIAVTTKNPVSAFMLFFIAVLLVIFGTYLLFTAGSIALLKLLRKNKGYYYKTRHFISVSSMMYRMKRNAVGLANICILSTMVLVMLSSTLSMKAGINDSLYKRYPAEFSMSFKAGDPLIRDSFKAFKDSVAEEGLKTTNEEAYRYYAFSAVYEDKTKSFSTDIDAYEGFSELQALNRLCNLVFVPLEDYNRCMGTNETIENDNDVLVCNSRYDPAIDSIDVFDESFHLKKELDGFMKDGNILSYMMNTYFIVVKDMSVVERVYDEASAVYKNAAGNICLLYNADIAGDSEKNKQAIENVYHATLEKLDSFGDAPPADAEGGGSSDPSEAVYNTASLDCRTVEEKTFPHFYDGMLFIGIFLGLLFIIATILIMYYKQLTEGYEDKKRFEILQNVGMSRREVKRSINSQILIVFFLPLVMAGVHVAFAFTFIFRILTLLSLFNFRLFALCTLLCFLVFALFYTITYKLTSRLYYRIVAR